MKRLFLLLTVAMCGVSFAEAQINHPNSREGQAYTQTRNLFGERQIDSLVVKALSTNMPNYFNAPSLPQFSIIGKERKFYMGIGGYAKGTVSYDFGNPISSSSLFTTSSIPMNLAAGNGGLFQIGAATSNISFNFVGMPETRDKIGAFVNFNFNGPNYGLSLLDAYATYRGFKIGYGQSLFTDVMAGPPTIDFEGPNSFTFINNVLLDYTYQWGKHWGVGVGMEMPLASYTNGPKTYTVYQQAPDIPFYLQYSWNNRSSWVRLSGIVRNMLYRDEVANANVNSTGWGVKVSGSAVIVKNVLTSYYQGIYGQGISSYIQDMTGQGLDMLPSATTSGRLNNMTSWGGYVGLQVNFTPTFFMSATYSFVRNSATDVIYGPNQYQNSQYVVTNLFWNLAPQVQMGVEYLWGNRQNADGAMGCNSRVQTMLQISF